MLWSSGRHTALDQEVPSSSLGIKLSPWEPPPPPHTHTHMHFLILLKCKKLKAFQSYRHWLNLIFQCVKVNLALCNSSYFLYWTIRGATATAVHFCAAFNLLSTMQTNQEVNVGQTVRAVQCPLSSALSQVSLGVILVHKIQHRR